MKTHRVWLVATISFLGGLSGCSGKIDPRKDCFKEFVQEFVLDDDAGSGRSNNVVCAGQDLTGPPSYPYSRRTVHLEYSEGDYSIVQTLRQWDRKQNRTDGCDFVSID